MKNNLTVDFFLGNDELTLDLFTSKMQTFKSMSSSLYRWRDKYLPPEPATQGDIILDHSFNRLGDDSIVIGDTIQQGNYLSILILRIYIYV